MRTTIASLCLFAFLAGCSSMSAWEAPDAWSFLDRSGKYPNGAPMAEGSVEKGKRQGRWLFWRDNNKMRAQVFYTLGPRFWVDVWHPNGALACRGFLEPVPGKTGQYMKQGFWQFQGPAGRIDYELTGTYTNDVQDRPAAGVKRY